MNVLIEKLPTFLRTRTTAFVHDLVMSAIAWLAAFWIRFNLGAIPQDELASALSILPLVVAVQGATFWLTGLYKGVWRFSSVPDLLKIIQATILGVAGATIAIFLLTRLENIPRSVLLLDGILLVLLLGGPRFAYRLLRDMGIAVEGRQRAIIVGAGRAGEMLVRDMLRGTQKDYQPVLFVDDDKVKQGREIHGIPVRGPSENLPTLVDKYQAELIVIALPSATSVEIRRVVEICEGVKIPFRSLPRLQDLVTGKVGIKELREVTIDDLLGRAQVELDWKSIGNEINGKTVLITGGGGSIGSELCRQIIRLGPKQLIVFDQSEFNLYEIELELRKSSAAVSLSFILGDSKDEAAVNKIFDQYRPNIVFHAAAYKHVPMLENQIRTAVRNNVVGTSIVANAAKQYGSSNFILVSTDKAVNPSNIMGTTKRAAEIVCSFLAEKGNTKFITVRFGNVLDSAGSVIPLFRRQIADGGPVTVTHQEIERYFMTIPEAAQLILQASAIGNGGEIFVLDMGEPIKIAYLAEQMIKLSGKIPNEDIDIVFTGLRPGEKMYEELFYDGEDLKDTSHAKILLAQNSEPDQANQISSFEELMDSSESLDESKLKSILSKLVPEYSGRKGNRSNQGSGEARPDNIIQIKRD